VLCTLVVLRAGCTRLVACHILCCDPDWHCHWLWSGPCPRALLALHLICRMCAGYASVIATSVSWRLAFLLEAPLMFPFVVLCWLLPERKKGVGKPYVLTCSCCVCCCDYEMLRVCVCVFAAARLLTTPSCPLWMTARTSLVASHRLRYHLLKMSHNWSSIASLT
jgi:hypothetical protein